MILNIFDEIVLKIHQNIHCQCCDHLYLYLEYESTKIEPPVIPKFEPNINISDIKNHPQVK